MLGKFRFIKQLGGGNGNAIAINESIKKIGSGATSGAEEAVESTVNGCI